MNRSTPPEITLAALRVRRAKEPPIECLLGLGTTENGDPLVILADDPAHSGALPADGIDDVATALLANLAELRGRHPDTIRWYVTDALSSGAARARFDRVAFRIRARREGASAYRVIGPELNPADAAEAHAVVLALFAACRQQEPD